MNTSKRHYPGPRLITRARATRRDPRSAAILTAATLSLLVALATAGPMLWAQTETDQAEVDTAPDDIPEGGAAAGNATAATDQEEGPIEDYEASEQISEDLSVSFPVDI